MKTIDVTKPVMHQVVRFEKRRSLWWLAKFFCILLVLFFAGAWFLWVAAAKITERRTLELLTLFTQDREVVAQFWQDTLMVIWEELPQKKLITAGIFFAGFIVFILLTKKRGMIVWKRISQIIKPK